VARKFETSRRREVPWSFHMEGGCSPARVAGRFMFQKLPPLEGADTTEVWQCAGSGEALNASRFASP
jgi:hypothetical protein